MTGPSALLEHLENNPLLLEAVGLVVCGLYLTAVTVLDGYVYRAKRRARYGHLMGLAVVCWLVIAHSMLNVFFSALGVSIGGIAVVNIVKGRLRRRGHDRQRVNEWFAGRIQAHGVIAALSPVFWGKSWLGQGWKFAIVAPLVGHGVGKVAQAWAPIEMKHRFRFKGGRNKTIEGSALYFAGQLLTQGLVFYSWSRIPGTYHDARVAVWAVASALVATVAELYTDEEYQFAAVPMVNAVALAIYVAA
ncbi:hypothetical protein KDL45_15210 [bacterium]|nr:hypothetical protein [bacterium]